MLNSLPNRNLVCGFIAGKDELLNGESSDLFRFYHDTIPILGSLDSLLEKINDDSQNEPYVLALAIFTTLARTILSTKKT